MKKSIVLFCVLAGLSQTAFSQSYDDYIKEVLSKSETGSAAPAVDMKNTGDSAYIKSLKEPNAPATAAEAEQLRADFTTERIKRLQAARDSQTYNRMLVDEEAQMKVWQNARENRIQMQAEAISDEKERKAFLEASEKESAALRIEYNELLKRLNNRKKTAVSNTGTAQTSAPVSITPSASVTAKKGLKLKDVKPLPETESKKTNAGSVSTAGRQSTLEKQHDQAKKRMNEVLDDMNGKTSVNIDTQKKLKEELDRRLAQKAAAEAAAKARQEAANRAAIEALAQKARLEKEKQAKALEQQRQARLEAERRARLIVEEEEAERQAQQQSSDENEVIEIDPSDMGSYSGSSSNSALDQLNNIDW